MIKLKHFERHMVKFDYSLLTSQLAVKTTQGYRECLQRTQWIPRIKKKSINVSFE